MRFEIQISALNELRLKESRQKL